MNGYRKVARSIFYATSAYIVYTLACRKKRWYKMTTSKFLVFNNFFMFYLVFGYNAAGQGSFTANFANKTKPTIDNNWENICQELNLNIVKPVQVPINPQNMNPNAQYNYNINPSIQPSAANPAQYQGLNHQFQNFQQK